MTNFSQTTFFAPKDTLPATDPNKTIFGAAYDVEFSNIATAIASKPDSSTVASFLSLTVTGNGPPANGLYLPSANTLGIAVNSSSIVTLAAGGIVVGGATGGAKGAGTINATGLYVNGVNAAAPTGAGTVSTLGYTGFVGSPTANHEWWVIGNFAFLQLGPFTGTSNATTFTITGLPAAIQPSANCVVAIPAWITEDSGATQATASASITGSVITMNKTASGGWTAAGIKGTVGTFMLIYPLVS